MTRWIAINPDGSGGYEVRLIERDRGHEHVRLLSAHEELETASNLASAWARMNDDCQIIDYTDGRNEM